MSLVLTKRHQRSLDEYASTLKHEILREFGGDTRVEHKFLEPENEASWEKGAIFGKENHKKIKMLLESWNIDVAETEVIFAQVGRSSTQICTFHEVIGTFYVGVDAMESEPQLLGDVLRKCVESHRAKKDTKKVEGPIILLNAISRWVNTDINFMQSPWSLSSASRRNWNAVVTTPTDATIRTISGTVRALDHLATVIQDLKLKYACILVAKERDYWIHPTVMSHVVGVAIDDLTHVFVVRFEKKSTYVLKQRMKLGPMEQKPDVVFEFHWGLDEMRKEPRKELFELLEQQINMEPVAVPIVLTGEIGGWVTQNIDLNKLQSKIIDINEQQVNAELKPFVTGGDETYVIALRKLLKDVVDPLKAQCFLKKEIKLKGDWVDILGDEVKNLYPSVADARGVYVVDLGGGGPDIRFYNPNGGVVKVGTARMLLNVQREFVSGSCFSFFFCSCRIFS